MPKKKKVNPIKDLDVIFIHGRDATNHPVVTVALSKVSLGYHYGLSVCSPDDNISKRIGRDKAKGRLVCNILNNDKNHPSQTLTNILTRVNRILKGKKKYKYHVLSDLSVKLHKALGYEIRDT